MLLLLLTGIALTLPAVQTKIGHYAADKINQQYKTDIHIDQIAISVFGGVKLKRVMIYDHHKDTLIYANRLQTNILSFKQLYNGDLLFGSIAADQLLLNMKIYKGEKDSNLDRFIKLFDTGKPSSGKFLMKAGNVSVARSRFILSDENLEKPKTLDMTRLDAKIRDLKIHGAVVTMLIDKMAFQDDRGLYVQNLSTDFKYDKTNIVLKKLNLKTEHSTFDGDIVLTYDKTFHDFNNKVRFDAKVRGASLASNDINYFYGELGKNRQFNFTSHLKGTLNDFYADKLRLKDDLGSEIIGNVNFKNLLGKKDQNFYMKGDFKKVASDYNSLTSLLPNILGKKLPTSLKKLGRFNLRGKAEVTTSAIDADFYMTTALGNIQSQLAMTSIDDIDKAKYKGYVVLENFNVGAFLERKDLGIVTLDLDVDGQGFKEKYLNTSFSGDILKVYYNGYTYTNVEVNGKFKEPKFTGKVFINDPNLFMDFDGTATLGKKDVLYDFHTKVDYADLVKLKLVKQDTISVFKGDVRMKVSGSTLDNMKGDIYITQTSYQNNKDTYFFDDFAINSSFDENRVRTISINSPDIIQGKIVGKFEFSQLRKMVENSLGSLYANYSPNKIKKGQFLRFDFAIYNKIIEIFYPGISVGANTVVNGNINSDSNDFKMNFSSPKIAAFDNYFHKVNVQIDNKNPLFNAFIEMDSIRTKYYKVSDFSLINVTKNDTLYVRTEFKGGNQATDFYNLNLYHTIDKNRNSIVGIGKSELKFKDYLWYLNEKDDASNRIVFDKKLRNFSIDNIVMSHEGQDAKLSGTVIGKDYKDLQLTFHDIDLNKITPVLDKFTIAGKLNGNINFKQDKAIYQPTSSLVIEDLVVNNSPLGQLNIDVRGDDSFKKFYVNSELVNKDVESFNASGDFTVDGKQTVADLDLRFNRFNLGALSSLGGDVITNIKGFASGSARIEGNLSDPEINGRLFLDETGLTIPYLNVNYELERKAVVDVTESSFIIRNSEIKDPKYGTVGFLNGRIRHNKFSDWKLDLDITSDRLLVLDTQDSEDAVYYGTAFIDGEATITGPTDALLIRVDAQSEKGTNIKIPINDAEAVGSNSFIHFKTPKEKANEEHGIVEKVKDYNGVDLKFNFDLNENAEIEVILDRATGHSMRGNGRGTLLFEINTLGKFNMWGDYQIYDGTYNFRYGGLIDKKFAVKKFSSIVWEGDPMRATLNLEAVYKTSANPAILVENPSFNKKVPVEVVIGIHGNLTNPEPDFNINFPTVSSVLKSEIQYKLDDKDVRQTQALYLLSSGGFLSPEGVSQSDFAGNLFERASGLFNDIFQDEDGKFVVGLDYVSADKRPGVETDGRVGFTVSTKVNERITINGKVGVPVGGINESAIVGDVEVQYRVNEDGTLNLRSDERQEKRQEEACRKAEGKQRSRSN
ncbi:MAG: translocation/assembly module TamB [Flavobacterium sp.]|nr:MAG: translocation/assembly module TamB [Flavobacterium sp.]